MATLIPSLPSVTARMTSGERRFAQRLESHLEDDYLCWYDVPIGPQARHPDFLILNPRRGILVVEVKDWRLDNILAIDKASVTLLTSQGQKHAANPLEQARQYAHLIVRLFEADKALIGEPGTSYAGKLRMPWGFGVALPNISRKAFLGSDLGNVIPSERVICQDEMTESSDIEAFQKKLWGMFSVTFPCTLSLPQVDRVRWHLFPEIRIKPVQETLIPEEAIPDIVRVMDLQQEQLARSLGEGHRVIHGVAGSGKTMILGYRALRLASLMPKPVLVLCFNVALAARLEQQFAAGKHEGTVSVRNFHRWCYDQLKLYQVPLPKHGAEDFSEQLVARVIAGVERGQIPRAQYGAVLIDEAHDFEADWLKLVVQMIDPETNSLLVLYDDAQSLYEKAKRAGFSFAQVGIQARGRSTILRLNYRNTAEVLKVAYEFAKEILSPREAEEDGVPLLAPRSVGRHGPVPELVRLPSLEAEVAFVAKRLVAFRRANAAWNDMAVVVRYKRIGDRIAAHLRERGIPAQWFGKTGDAQAGPPERGSVKLLTMHASKGLEFPVVIVAGACALPDPRADPAGEARLLYVAMTRAMDQLVLTCYRQSTFVERLQAAIAAAA